MGALQLVLWRGWLFVQCHIEQPPKRDQLRAIAADLDELPAAVKAAGHDRALVGIQADNPRMADFVTRRGFSYLQDYAHLKLFIRYV